MLSFLPSFVGTGMFPLERWCPARGATVFPAFTSGLAPACVAGLGAADRSVAIQPGRFPSDGIPFFVPFSVYYGYYATIA